MKSNVPWSIKGIDREARDVAKNAAKEAGMTLGEWLTTQINKSGGEEQVVEGPAAEPQASHQTSNVQAIPANVVTVDQLREMVYSLNRLNERLKTAERDSRQALTGLNQGLTSTMQRLRKVEADREAGTDTELLERLEKLENGRESRAQIDNLMSLEQALTKMVEQFDRAQKDTIARVDAHDEALGDLDKRLVMMDTQTASAVAQVRDDVDEVMAQLQQTEKTARAVMLEARAAAQTSDAEFIERTGNKLRILGNEIKRSGDQIKTLEGHIDKLSGRIEGSEERSASGIAAVSEALASLREELDVFDRDNAEQAQAAKSNLVDAGQDSDDKLGTLQSSFDRMISRLEDVVETRSEEQPAAEEEPVAATDTVSQALHGEAEATATNDMPGEEDFDAVFGDTDEAQVTASEGEGTESDKDRPALTPKQKVLLAARARRRRQEEELAKEAETPAAEPDAEEAEPETLELTEADEAGAAPAGEEAAPEDDNAEEEKAVEPPPFSDDAIFDAIAGGNLGGDEEEKSQLQKLRAKFGSEGERKLPLIPIIAIGAALLISALAWFILKDSMGGGNATSATAPVTPAAGTAETLPEAATAASPAEEFRRWQVISANANTPEDKARALEILKSAARKNHPPAQFALGRAYEDGTAGDPRPGFARSWYETAAEAGNIDAMYELGKIYSADDIFTSISWFEQGAAYGHLDSVFNLALIYDPDVELEGVSGASKDAAQAYYWYRIAEKLGDAQAGEGIAALGPQLSAEQVTELDQRAAGWSPNTPISGAN